jgi:Flp pilus assembly protein TadD
MSFAKAALLSAVLISFGASAAYAQMGSMAPTPQREDPAVPYQAGVAAFNARNYPEAIRQLRVARRASPTDGAINYALGLAYAANGDKSEAKSSFERAVSARNAPIPARLQLGLVALELGDRDTATEQQTALQRMITACDAQCGDARRGQMQSALDQLTRALAAP